MIDRLRTWAVLPGAGHSQKLGDLFEKITLFGGIAGDPIVDDKTRDAECECHGLTALQATILVAGNPFSQSPNIVLSPVTYGNGSSYQESGKLYSLWQIEFQNLRWHVPGGVAIAFAIEGVGRSTTGGKTPYLWFNHASAIKDTHRLTLYDHRRLPKSYFDNAGQNSDKSVGINVQVWGQKD